MRLAAALVFVCTAAVSVPMAMAQTQGNTTTTGSCTPLKRIYAESNWQDAHPAKGQTPCPPQTRAGARNTIRHFRLWRRYRQVSPYAGFHEGDRWLEWLPIPAYIVQCETNGSRGRGRWTAANASGAEGPAQLLGWGAPYPANTPAEKVRYWEIARHVLEVQGLTAWSCA